MSRQQRTRVDHRRRQPGQGRGQSPDDVWRLPGELPEFEPITPPADVGAMLRSLGDPPMAGSTAAGHYFDAVAQRAANMARIVAIAAEAFSDE